MHESRCAEASSVRVAGKLLRKTEILGLLIFILMAAVMLAVGAALFCDWLAEPGSAPVGTPAELGPISGGLWIAGAIPVVPLAIGVEVVGGLSLIALYMLSGVRRGM
jgi:multicomponent Na+:H+ antiporter subunit B